jgi:DnaJ-class molecular chaperone
LSDEDKKANYDNRMFGTSSANTKSSNDRTSTTKSANRPTSNMTAAQFAASGKAFESFFGYDPKNDSPELKKKNDEVKPMSTSKAFETIFGKRFS